jgi:DNA mismatch repair protein MutL
MGRIKVLPDAVVNKIAAGEVVERPASVVKELVENAIDAGATDIRVEVHKGGRSLIRVRDNGCGMARDDALLALERHSTSKIAVADDLVAVRTMGFRGEALPSIAAVSRLELTTKERGALAGTRIIVEGGTVLEVREAGAPDGTEVVARDLFFNTPVRRTFLRSERAEIIHITAAVMYQALPRAAVGFTLIADDEELIKAPPVRGTLDRISSLFGADLAGELVPFHGERGHARVSGFVSRPEVTRGNRSGQHFFVNVRPVQDRILSFAVAEACEGVIPARRHPLLFLFIEIEPQAVDVNVHPAKREVRFRNGALVRDLVHECLSSALRGAGLGTAPAVAEPASRYETKVGAGLFERVPATPAAQGSLPWEPADGSAVAGGGLRPLGQVGSLYVVCDEGGTLAIIDQHAAHERVLFEEVMKLHAGGHGELQRLLIPAVVNLSPAEYAVACEYAEVFRALGIGVEPFGKNAVKIDHLPACLGPVDPERLARDVIGELAEEGRSRAVKDELARDVAAKVCRAAVKKRDALTVEEMRRLVADLVACETPHTCPHGRPTMIRLSPEELEKRFGRT